MERFMKHLSIVLAALCLAIIAGAAHSQTSAALATFPEERRSTLNDQQSVAVTIYNDDLALVKDARRLTFERGRNVLALRDVSARIRPETAQLRSLDKPGSFDVFEQNFDFDLLTPAKLLEKYVGRTVRIVHTHPTTGAETYETAEVLSATNGVVLKIGDRVETGVPGRIVYDSVPANLRDRPTLVTWLNSQSAGTQAAELSYLTGGLSWQADYVAELNPDDSSLELAGWVTLTNRSGTAYPNAQVQLVAGDVNRVKEEMRRSSTGGALMAAPAKASVVQEALFEYHLYTLGRTTTLADNQTKQVALLSASGVPITKELLLNGSDYYYRSSIGDIGQKLKVGVNIEFDNRESAHLGLPLPKGVVRVYKRDSHGNAQFVGEDRIDHTPKNEKVRLHLGDAFDVTADKKQVAFESHGLVEFESAYEIVLRNAKPEPVNVVVREPVPGDWKMLEESQPHVRAAAGTAQWVVAVPAGGMRTLKYRVLVRY
jgi:hypothetical protein